MKRFLITTAIAMLAVIIYSGCSDDYPIDGDGLLVTTRAECYVSSFRLVDMGHQIATTSDPKVDTLACTIHAEVFYGTDLKNLYPQFTLVTDAKLDPKVTGFVDFSDLSNPKQYTVVSGNRKVRKTYTIHLSVQQP